MRLAPREAVTAARVAARGNLGRYSNDDTSETDRLETELGRFAGVDHVLAVNSGTSALVCALVGLEIGAGDEVLIPGYTFVATAAAIAAVGATPVLVEIDESLTMDPADLGAKITPKSRCVIPVHMRNSPADLDAIGATARAADLIMIEDACQAAGVRYRGQPLGSFGHVATFSFNQFKNMRAGEGGALLTSDAVVHARAGRYHDVGSYMRERDSFAAHPPTAGLNLRMPELCSAILRPQLAGIDRQMARRHARREIYVDALTSVEGVRPTPHHSPDDAVGFSIGFDDPDHAKSVADRGGGELLRNSKGHVFDLWEPFGFDPESCPATVKILARTIGVNPGAAAPMALVRRRAAALAAAI